MGYDSFNRLPSITTHAKAVTWLERTTPLRKTKETANEHTIYPLGDRRYARRFSIRRVGDDASRPKPTDNGYHNYEPAPGAQADDIELLLYRSPVVTLHKPEQGEDGKPLPQELTIYGGAWHWSSADLYFLSNVLYPLIGKVYTKQGVLVFNTDWGDGKRVVAVKKNGYVRMRVNPTTRKLEQVESNDTVVENVLRLNRAETNNVRREYGRFYRYLKGLMSLRTEQVETFRHGEIAPRMAIALDELLSTVPPECIQSNLQSVRLHIAWKGVTSMRNKPAIYSSEQVYNEEQKKWMRVTSNEPYKRWLAQTEEYIKLIGTADDDPAQTDNFYHAFRLLLRENLMDARMYGLPTDRTYFVDPKQISEYADEVLFKYYSERVIEVKPRAKDKVPSTKYDTWVTREHG